jgi:peptidoglycan-associated lipoprotein
MRTTWIVSFAVALAAGLAACSGGPVSEQPGAGVEDRTPTAKTEPQQIKTEPVAPRDLTGKTLSADEQLKKGELANRSIFYDLDSYDVKDQYKPLVEAHAKFLRDNPGRKMLVQGNTDERGSREYNVSLGQRRADGVKKMLLLLGAKEDQVESVSLGEEKPKSEGHDEQAWAQNRRCDILYQGEY